MRIWFAPHVFTPEQFSGFQILVHANLNSCEVVVAAADGEGAGRDSRIALYEQRTHLTWRQRGLLSQMSKLRRDMYQLLRLTRMGKKLISRQTGAGAVRLPFVLEQRCVRVDVSVLRGTGGAGIVAAILWIGAVVILRPQAMQREGTVLSALGRGGVPVAELWRPRKVEHVKVELAWCRGKGPAIVMTVGPCRRASTSTFAARVSRINIAPLVSASVAAGPVICLCPVVAAPVVAAPIVVRRLVAAIMMVAMTRFSLVGAVVFVIVG